MLKFHVNTHSTIQSRQKQFLINIWAGIVGDYFLGPYFCLIGSMSLLTDISEHFMRLDTIPLDIRQETCGTYMMVHWPISFTPPEISFRLRALGDRHQGEDQCPRKLVHQA